MLKEPIVSSAFDEKPQVGQQKQTSTQGIQVGQVRTLQLPSFEEFKKKIEEQGLYYPDNLLKAIYETIHVALQKNKVPAFLLVGPPGSGKTSLAEAIANALGAKLLFYQATYNASEDNVLYEFIPSSKAKSGVKITYGILPKSLILSREEPVVVVIDEIDKTRPSFDAVFLDYLQNARVTTASKKILQGNPHNLIVFATSNNERELSEPLLRRFAVINVPPPTLSLVSKILHQHFDDENLINTLLGIYVATHNLQLRKPATIQELILAGKMLEKGLDLDTVLRTHILKYPEDVETFYQNINNPDIYNYVPQKGEKIDIKLRPVRIMGSQEEEEEDESYNNETEMSEQQMENEENKERSSVRIKPFAEVKKIEAEDATNKDIEADVIITFENPAEDITKIVNRLGLLPSNHPNYIGPFKIVTENGKTILISTAPLSLNMMYNIIDEPLTIKKIDANIWTIITDVTPLDIVNRIKRFAEDNGMVIDESYYTSNEISYKLKNDYVEIIATFKRLGKQLYDARIQITTIKEPPDNSIDSIIRNFIVTVLMKYTLEEMKDHSASISSISMPLNRFIEIIKTLNRNNMLESTLTKTVSILVDDYSTYKKDSISEPVIDIKEEEVRNDNFVFNPFTGKLMIPHLEYKIKPVGYYSNSEQEKAINDYFDKVIYNKYGHYYSAKPIRVNSLEEALKELEEVRRLVKEAKLKSSGSSGQ